MGNSSRKPKPVVCNCKHDEKPVIKDEKPVIKEEKPTVSFIDHGPNVKEDVDELVKLEVNSFEFKIALIKLFSKIDKTKAILSHYNSQLLMLEGIEKENIRTQKYIITMVYDRYCSRNKAIR